MSTPVTAPAHALAPGDSFKHGKHTYTCEQTYLNVKNGERRIVVTTTTGKNIIFPRDFEVTIVAKF